MAREFTFGAGPERLRRLLFEGMEEPNGQEDVTLSQSDDSTQSEGEWIGNYRLIHTLGEGGMGIVYFAEQQEPIRRKVALKVIRPGMDSKRVMARFEAERQALALLDHPNIAHVYDTGTTESGRPYFVMEYVKGLSITEHCDQHKLTIEERLQLAQLVCQAVQHAHQRGIIHRDLKPSNILVSIEGDRAVPKIIDFGVAKALAQPLTERTLATEDSQLLGTPEYMSPEQADMASVDIDTRSDIYSLGVLLYVLLTGALPFDSDTLRTGGIDHIRNVIRETDPKTPSTRLTKLGEEAQKVAENRRTEIGKLAKHLRKELEWIPLKAMRKDRAERYRSASELADDIENYLNGDALIAGPPGIMYRLKKLIRRHRALVTGFAAVLVVLIAGVVVSILFAVGQARSRAEAQLITDFLMNDVLGAAAEARIGEATAIYMLDNASRSLEGQFDERPLVKALIHERLGWVYGNIGELRKGEQHYLHAIRLYQQHLGNEHSDTLRARDGIAYHVYEEQGRYRDMEHQFTKTRSRNGLGATYLYLGKYEDAARILEEALESHKAWYGQGGKGFDVSPYLMGNLARVYTAQGRYKEAERLFAKTEWRAVGFSYGLASLYREQGRYSDAETLFNKALETLRQDRGDEHFWTVWCMGLFVQLYLDQERYEEAETLLDEALPIARRRMRPGHPVTLDLVNARAVLHTKQGEYEDAESLFKEALKGRRRELGDDHPETLETKNDLAILYKEQSDYDEAEPLLLEAIEGRRLKLGDTHPHTQESIKILIALYDAWNKPEQAKEWRSKLEQIEDFEE